MTDIYTPYETGLRALLERLGRDHPRYDDALVYQQRLAENIASARRYGDTKSLDAGRAEIVDRLNALAREALGVSYNDLCQGATPLLDLDSAEAQAARERYLEALWERCKIIEPHSYVGLAQDKQAGSPRPVPLLGEGGVYVPLRFDAPTFRQEAPLDEMPKDVRRGLTRAEWESRPETLAEILRLFPGHLAIVGDAGSGKTTVLRVLVNALAAQDPHAIAPDLAPILPHPRPIPIFLPLRFFEHACRPTDDGPPTYTRCVKDLLRFLDDWFAHWSLTDDLPPEFLADHVRQGRAWLLLDALDEVANPTHRETVRHVIQELAGQAEGTRLIVTARVPAYRSAPLTRHFVVVTVRDLDEEQRTQLVYNIYRGLVLPDADRRAKKLTELLHNSELLQGLTRTPVMVWTAAAIHALQGELPESRAALYDAYVDILLKRSYERTQGDAGAMEPATGGRGWSLPDRRHYLTYTAFEAHRLLETQPERRSERHVVVGEGELADQVLAPYFHHNLGHPLPEARRQAREFLTLMVEHSGLVYETDEGYTIGDHLTMQEFLAGCYLGMHLAFEDPEGYVGFLREKVGQSWWREVFLLAAGHLAEQPGFQAREFLKRVGDQGADPADRLVALALAGEGLLQLRARRQPPTWYAGLAQTFANRLYSLLYAEPVEAPVEVRQEAGLVLGLLYGYPDEEGLPDPRFAHPSGISLPAFVPIAGGPFWMGQNDGRENERPRHRVHLSPYEIARYPTTNAMFAHFVADDGYGDERWWPEAIDDEYWRDGKVKDWVGDWYDLPRFWDDPKWNNPSQPVVGVNWYEAVAYCRWLTAALDDGHEYRLPTEAQWERAARGTSSYIGMERAARGKASPPHAGGTGGGAYPWGDDWRDDHCNSEEAGLSVTSPVGLFPRGAAEGDVHDMVGNVWEWCRDWYGTEYYADSQGARDPTGPEQGEGRVVRGGSYLSEGPSRCRCGSRIRGYPGNRFYDWGFRCVRTSPQAVP